ncbi:sugar ABC transporter substrate-binding protein [Paenibacillus albidus]|uniref:ABC transporter substrate-binding protein n=1 Tax=Paenibacillus albidus TaxID=2041023 RepID=UPI001BEB64F9|nr:sugar ABC transporter substrate-binding protein [Paenibacillus albidus]MBT2291042.1 sugar ABC transporter substrate-binding protein [Paenibacillus albidus]
MKFGKRKLVMSLALTMALSSLAGCSGNGGNESGGNAAPASPAGNGGEATKDITLELLYWGDDVQKKLVEATAEKYTAETGVKINAQVLPADGSFDTFIQTRLESGELPDISYMGEGDIQKYNEMGILEDITDLMKDGSIPEKLPAITIHSPEQKVIGVGLSNQMELLFYSKSKFDAAGVPYPPSKVEEAWDWDTFLANAKKLTTDTKGKTAADSGFDASLTENYGIGVTAGREFHHFWAAYANGGGVVSPDGAEFQWDSPKSAEGIQRLADLANKDKVSSAFTYTWNSGIGSAVDALSGGYAMVISGSWDLANINGNEDIGVGVLPKMEKAVTMNCGAPLVVYNTSKHKEEAKKFYAYMVNPENSLELLKTGAWLPNQADWYTDAALVDKWTADLPESAKETILSYATTKDAIVQWPAYYVPAYLKMNTEYEKSIDQALSGQKSVKEVYDSIMPAIKQLWESGKVS